MRHFKLIFACCAFRNLFLLPNFCGPPPLPFSYMTPCVGDKVQFKKPSIRIVYKNTQRCSSPRQQVALQTHGFQVLFLAKLLSPHPVCSFPGLCALSINHSNSYLAYPGSQTTGEIVLYDGNSLVRSLRSLVHQPACPGQLVNRLR